MSGPGLTGTNGIYQVHEYLPVEQFNLKLIHSLSMLKNETVRYTGTYKGPKIPFIPTNTKREILDDRTLIGPTVKISFPP